MARFAPWLQWLGLSAPSSLSKKFCQQILASGLGHLLHRLPPSKTLHGPQGSGYLRAYAAAVVRDEAEMLGIPSNLRDEVIDRATVHLVELAGVELQRQTARPKPVRIAA